MSDKHSNKTYMEEISSTSRYYTAKKDPIIHYADGIYSNLANVIKTIAFVVAFLVIILGFVLAFFLFNKTGFAIALCGIIILVCTAIAACIFFPLFGIGQILCQNNEILKKLNDKKE